MDNDGCPSHGWSIIASAMTYSQLAGLLGGFIFSGIVMLFALRGPKCTKALSLFCTTFILLEVDSYLFGLVSGDTQDPHCTRVWSEGMAACGMFAVGTAGLFSGICWLLSVRVDSVAPTSSDDHGPRLDLIGSLMVHGTNISASLLLARTAFDYLDVIYKQRASLATALWQWVYAVPAIVGGTTLILVWHRSRHRTRTSSVKSDEYQRKWVSFTVYGVIGYGIGGLIFTGALTNLPDSLWQHPPLPLVVATVAMELLVPGALLVGLVLTVPSLRQPTRSLTHFAPATPWRSSERPAMRAPGSYPR